MWDASECTIDYYKYSINSMGCKKENMNFT